MTVDDQRAYDRGTSIFSPDGRLYQVEYAREAVSQGAPVVGVCGADGVALAAHVPRRSPLVRADSVEKLHVIDGRIGVASAGHAADARRLVDIARRSAQAERLRYDEPATVESVATTVADHVQEHTQAGGARPYGTALLVAGVGDEPRLFETDPSGATQAWRADAVGRGADEAVAHFEEHYRPELTTADGLGLALDGLSTVVDDLASDEVDAVTVDAGGYAAVSGERVGELLAG